MKKKYGFTLIELLAVIVILAIILLIATPIILNTVENTKKASFKVTAGMIVRAADNEYSRRLVSNENIFNLTYEYVNGEFNGDKDLEYSGKRPKNGVVNITENGKVELSIHDGTYCAWKETDSDEIYIDKKSKEECGIEAEQEPTDVSCFEYEESTIIESFDIDYDVCVQVFTNMSEGQSSPEEVNAICSGGDVQGFTIANAINMGYIPAEQLESLGVIYNVVKSGEIEITGYDHGNYPTCSNDVVIPKKINQKDVISIGESSFVETGITSVVIPNSVKTIKAGAFRNNRLTSLNLGLNVEIIGSQAFAYNQLVSVTIPDNVIIIGASAFDNNQLTTLNLGLNIETIMSGAFRDNQLTRIIIPDSVKIIEDDAFIWNQLTNVKLGSNVISIDYNAFRYNQLTEVIIPNSVKKIDDYAFAENQLTNVILGSNIEYLSGFNSNYLTNIVIPNNVTTIGDYAFYNNKLTEVIIPNNITMIGKAVFAFNPTLTKLTVLENNESYKSVNNAIYTKDGTKLITGTKVMSNNIESTATIIGDHAFDQMDIISLTIPNNVTTIGDHAFRYNQLTEVIIPNNVATIGDYAFYWNQLTKVEIPSSIRKIGSGAFSTNQLTELTLANGVIEIGPEAFSYNRLISVTIPNSVTTIGSWTFTHNKIPQGHAKIDNSAGNVSIGDFAFDNNGLDSNQTITPTYLK